MATSFTFTVTDPEGMHARPAGKVVEKAQSYQSSITLTDGDKTVDAKRIFGVMGLGAKCGDTITVNIDGEDEATAFVEFEQFLKENL
ncbi:HPr family phosphocarrier protein [Bifidobacterium sp. ESL0745]|uniref:HPr family phosphocarrier protein n=1 Tax=Bifidobacterium sp. ESL0745 TaxID=2983226 RepID=UPI0023F78619|nr:HPr family phosphocarrier protein [Bifidobacterium sp. ESL0745]MDF7665758.1 HPr family phosphocarrier protein [Bifidobacterium sp. ESL0745]